MSPVVADASVAIRGDLQPFMRDIRGAERATGDLGMRLRDAFSAKNILKTGALFGIGSTLPGVFSNVIGLVGDASAEFQNLERATRSVDDIFGASAQTIRDWGESAADAAGLSKREVSESAAILGSMLQNVGFDAAESADQVVNLQQRGSDLAATYGGEATEAIHAIGSLLRGEFDTIEQFGVKIKQADVNARILALGLDTSTNEAKRNAEAVAALSIFYDQTGDASGRFAENLDTLSGKLDANQAKIDNFMASVGQGVANFQLEAIEDTEQLGMMGEEIGRFFDGLAMNFGSQHVEILRLADATGAGFGEMKERIQAEMNATGQTFDQVVDGIEARLAGLTPVMSSETLRALAAWKQADLGGAIVGDMETAADGMAGEVGEAPGKMADELLANQFELTGPEGAIAELVDFMDQALSPLEELFNARAFLASEELAAGLASGTPAVRRKAEEMRDEALAVLNVDWSSYGYNLGSTYADGLGRAIALVAGAARGIASATGRQIGIESEPKALDSPLRGITKWGGNLVNTYAEGILGELGSLDRASSAMAGRLIPNVTSGFDALSSPTHRGAALAGGTTINVYSQSLVPGGPAERRAIVQAISGFVDEGLIRTGRLPRRGTEGGV